jgi:hypothetical protein
MGRDPALEREWRGRLRRHEKSGLTVRAFCEQEGVSEHRFFWWRRRLKQGKSPASQQARGSRKRENAITAELKRRPSFLPVEIAGFSTEPSAHLEIVVDQPPRIRVAPGFDAELLRQVVRALEQS